MQKNREHLFCKKKTCFSSKEAFPIDKDIILFRT